MTYTFPKHLTKKKYYTVELIGLNYPIVNRIVGKLKKEIDHWFLVLESCIFLSTYAPIKYRKQAYVWANNIKNIRKPTNEEMEMVVENAI